MAAKKRTTAAPATHQHQLESDYLSPAQRKVFAKPTPRVARVAPSEAKTPAKKSSAKRNGTKASTRKRAVAKKTVADTPGAAE